MSILQNQSEIHGHLAEIAVLQELETHLSEIDKNLARRIMDHILANIGAGTIVSALGLTSYLAVSSLVVAGSPLIAIGAAMFGAGLFLQRKVNKNA